MAPKSVRSCVMKASVSAGVVRRGEAPLADPGRDGLLLHAWLMMVFSLWMISPGVRLDAMKDVPRHPFTRIEAEFHHGRHVGQLSRTLLRRDGQRAQLAAGDVAGAGAETVDRDWHLAADYRHERLRRAAVGYGRHVDPVADLRILGGQVRDAA